jgi:hypothetical protein
MLSEAVSVVKCRAIFSSSAVDKSSLETLVGSLDPE